MLNEINRYSGWFSERARRATRYRYVCFTKLTLPLDFTILVPEFSFDVADLHRIVDEDPYKVHAPKLIFDQEEQFVIRTINDEVVLNLIKKIIKNEIEELEETGSLSGNWRTNPVRYFTKKESSSQTFGRESLFQIN